MVRGARHPLDSRRTGARFHPPGRRGGGPLALLGRALELGFGIALALAVALGPSGCTHAPGSAASGTSAETATSARPPFYRVTGGPGATLLLLGTVHIGPAGGWSLSPAVESGIARADSIALEIDPRLATEETVSTLLAELVVLPPDRTLADLLAPETIALLERNEAEIARLGFPQGMRKRMKPWFVAVGLTDAIYLESGHAAAGGVEPALVAALGGRPLLALETLEEQMRLIDDLPVRLQDLMLRDTVSRLDEAKADIDELLDAWRRGDETALARIAREGIDEYPELDGFYDVLLGDRNRRWTARLAPMTADPAQAGRTILVGVGALHLVGRDSLVEFLREAGLEVEAIDHAEPIGALAPRVPAYAARVRLSAAAPRAGAPR